MTSDPNTLCFVLASPRSGTTWLKAALNAHPDIFCTEHRFFGRHYDLVRDEGREQPRLRITLDRYVDSLLEHYEVGGVAGGANTARRQIVASLARALVRVGGDASGKRIVVDKITPYLDTADEVVRQIHAIFPQAKIIHLVRDGRDVLVSGVFHWLTKARASGPDLADTDVRRAWIADPAAAPPRRRFFTDGEINEWARTWRQPIDAMRALPPSHARLLVRYEDMLESHGTELTRIVDFLGASAHTRLIEQCATASTFERMSGGRRRGEERPTAHIRKGIAGDWRNYFTVADGRRFHAIAGQHLAVHGYERDAAWIERLPEQWRVPAPC